MARARMAPPGRPGAATQVRTAMASGVTGAGVAAMAAGMTREGPPLRAVPTRFAMVGVPSNSATRASRAAGTSRATATTAAGTPAGGRTTPTGRAGPARTRTGSPTPTKGPTAAPAPAAGAPG